MRQLIMDDDKSIILDEWKKIIDNEWKHKKLCCMPILMAL